MPEKLTSSFIKNLKPRSKKYIVTDSQTTGLCVMVRPNGNKRYYYRYRDAISQKVVEEPIGCAHAIKLQDARDAAIIKSGERAKGIDIRAKRQAAANKNKEATQNDLKLFNYIEIYYTPYALKNSATATEIIKTLKKEFEFVKDKPINIISSDDIEQWRQKRSEEVTYKSLKIFFTYLKACINTAVKHYKLIDNFPLNQYHFKRKVNEKINPPKLRFLSDAEEKRLLATLKQRDQNLREKRSRYVEWQAKRNHSKKHVEHFTDKDYPDHVTPIVILAYQTGFDLGDLFDLDWQQHIDFENSQIAKIRNKTSHNQDNPQPVIVPMTPMVKSILKQWGEQHGKKGRIFKSPKTGGRLDNINTAWSKIRESAGLNNFRFKDLRHTFASRLAISGCDILVIRDLMGHTDVKTTQIYAHLRPEQKNDAILQAFG